MVILGAVIGSALPDADTPFSGIGKTIPLWIFSPDRYNCHRKITHSLIFALLIGTMFSFINKWVALGLLEGILLHIWADSTTKVGVPYLLWPIKYNPDHPYFKIKEETE